MLFRIFSNWHISGHDFIQTCRQSYGLLIVALIIFSLLIPFSTAGLPGSSIFNVEHTHQQLKFRLFNPEVVPALQAAVVLYGLGLGIALFRFLLDKRMVAVFFSLGLSRARLFGVRYAVGLLFLFLGIGLPLLFSLGLNLLALGLSPGLGQAFFSCWLGFLLLGLIAFTVTIICCSGAGTQLEAVLFSGAVLLLPTVLCGGVNALMRRLLWGNAFGAPTYSGGTEIYPSLVWLLAPVNPLLFFWRPAEEQAMFYRSLTQSQPDPFSWAVLGGWLLAAVAVALLALWVFRKRRAEQAGISGDNPYLAAAALFGACFTSAVAVLYFVAGYSKSLAYPAMGLVFALCYLLLRVTLFNSTAPRGKQLAGFLGQGAVLALVVLLVAGGGLGYRDRVPAAKEVRAVTFSYLGSPNYLAGEVFGSSSGKGYYLRSEYTYTEARDVRLVTQLHKQLAQMGPQDLAWADDFDQTVLPYDLVLDYRLRDGSRLVRYYDRATVDLLSQMLALDEGPRVTAIIKQVVQGLDEDGNPIGPTMRTSAANCYANGRVYFSDSWYSSPYAVQLSAGQRRELLIALAADLERQGVEERYFPQAPPLGVLMFSLNGEKDSRSFAYDLTNTLVYVTESFTQTNAYLSRLGLLDLFDFQDEVESMVLQPYNPYDGINKRKTPLSSYFVAYKSASPDDFLVESDFGRKRPLTDPDKLAQLLPLLQNCYFMRDGGYLVAVKLSGRETYVYKYLPLALVPDFLGGSESTR